MALVRRRRNWPNQFFVPYNGKIADITHADTALHTLDLAAALAETRKIIAVMIGAKRMAGTGDFLVDPNESGGAIVPYSNDLRWMQTVVISNATQRLQYSLGVANDDFDLYCWGYVVEA